MGATDTSCIIEVKMHPDCVFANKIGGQEQCFEVQIQFTKDHAKTKKNLISTIDAIVDANLVEHVYVAENFDKIFDYYSW